MLFRSDTFPNRWGLLDQWHRQLRTEKRTRFPFNEVLLANLAMKYRQDSEEACKLIDMLFGSSLDYLAKFPPGKPPDPDPGPLTLAPDPDP